MPQSFSQILAATLAIASLLQPCYAICNSFIPLPNPYSTEQVYTQSGSTVRVSDIVNCTGSNLGSQPSSSVQQRCNATTCSLAMPLDYFVRVNSTLNVSVTSDAEKRNIFDLAKLNVTGLQSSLMATDLNVTMVHTTSTASTCLNEGTAAFWGFTPTLNCVEGLLRGCTGDTAALNNTAVTVCGVQMLGSDYSQYNGVIGVVNTNDILGDRVQVPPNATMSGTNPLPTSGAVRFHAGLTATFIALAGIVLLVGF